MRAAVAALGLILLAGGCGGHGSTATGCDAARLNLAQGAGYSEATGRHTLLLEIDAGSGACRVDGYPRVELLGAKGTRLPFSYAHSGSIMLPQQSPAPVAISPGQPAYVALDKYRCDVRSTDAARTVRLTLPGTATTLSLKLDRDPILDYCTETPSLQVAVTPVLPTQQAAFVPAYTVDPTGRRVLRDVFDGRLDTAWSCGSLRAAIARLPADPPTFSTIPLQLMRAAATTCAGTIQTVVQGSGRAAASRLFGAPDRSGPNCSLWKWNPEGGSIDGVRICFDDGRVAEVQTAVHA